MIEKTDGGGYTGEFCSEEEGDPFVLLKPKNICGDANFIFHTPAGWIYGPVVFKNLHNGSLTCLCTRVSPLLLPCPSRRGPVARVYTRTVYERTKYNASRAAKARGPSLPGGLKNPSIVVGDRKYPICPAQTTPRANVRPFRARRASPDDHVSSLGRPLPWALSPGEGEGLKSPNGCAFKRLIASPNTIRQRYSLDTIRSSIENRIVDFAR